MQTTFDDGEVHVEVTESFTFVAPKGDPERQGPDLFAVVRVGDRESRVPVLTVLAGDPDYRDRVAAGIHEMRTIYRETVARLEQLTQGCKARRDRQAGVVAELMPSA